MVFRYIQKVSTVVSLVLFLLTLWSLYYLTFPRPATNRRHSKVHNQQIPHAPPSKIQSLQHVEFMLSLKHKIPQNSSKSQPVHETSPSVSHVKQLFSNTSDFIHLNSPQGVDLLQRIKTDCKDSVCSEFLTSTDKPHFKYCIHKTWGMSLQVYVESKRSVCVFINGSHRYPIGLASYPGSGNTWVRGLLQKATGLCIGGVYCDKTLRKNGFPGESIRSGVTFMVKTHQTDPRWMGVEYPPNAPFTYFKKREHVPVYSGGVFILRNPFHAMVAEFKRKKWEDQPDNHIKSLGKENFGNNSKWEHFVLEEAMTWYQTVKGWVMNNMKHPILVVKYEDMVQNTKLELERILEFVQVPYSRQQLVRVVEAGYREYKRPHDVEFEHYTVKQKEYVCSLVAAVAPVLALSIEDYMHSERVII